MKQATADLTLGGHRVVASGALSAMHALAITADFATEHALRESGSLVAKRALKELHDLMGDSRLTTAQKNHVADAISALKKIGPLKDAK